MLTSKPRSSRPATMDGPVGPVPPITRADVTTRVRLLDFDVQKLIYTKLLLACKRAPGRHRAAGRVTTALLVPSALVPQRIAMGLTGLLMARLIGNGATTRS